MTLAGATDKKASVLHAASCANSRRLFHSVDKRCRKKKAHGSAFVPLHDLLNVRACNIAHFGSSRAVKQAATPRSEQRADAALAI